MKLVSGVAASRRGRGSRLGFPSHWFQLLWTTPPASTEWGVVALPELTRTSVESRGKFKSQLVRLHHLGCRTPTPTPFGCTFPASASSGRLPVCESTPGRVDGPGAWFFQLLRGRKASCPVNTGHWIPKKTVCFICLWMSGVSVPASLTLLKLFPPIGTLPHP